MGNFDESAHLTDEQVWERLARLGLMVTWDAGTMSFLLSTFSNQVHRSVNCARIDYGVRELYGEIWEWAREKTVSSVDPAYITEGCDLWEIVFGKDL